MSNRFGASFQLGVHAYEVAFGPLLALVTVPVVGTRGDTLARRWGAGAAEVAELRALAVGTYLACVPFLLVWFFLTIGCGIPWRNGYC
jgi:hypothetical protein